MILQIFFILTFVAINDLSIKTISVEILDELLNNKIINTLFILMCLLVLINGFNFLDGINCLTIGYFTIFLISIYYTSVRYNLLVDLVFLENLMIILSIILIFNFFGRSFLGDSGTYSIGFLVGIISIKYAFENYFQMSPYFIVSLLWYPALENLFSIIRRMYLKLSPAKPDNFHLHHLIYFFLKKKISNKKDNLFINSLAGILINVYILGLSLFATLYYNHTKTLVFIIIFNILVYLLTYTYLNNKLKTHNKNV